MTELFWNFCILRQMSPAMLLNNVSSLLDKIKNLVKCFTWTMQICDQPISKAQILKCHWLYDSPTERVKKNQKKGKTKNQPLNKDRFPRQTKTGKQRNKFVTNVWIEGSVRVKKTKIFWPPPKLIFCHKLSPLDCIMVI